jgi:hypothetical protein
MKSLLQLENSSGSGEKYHSIKWIYVLQTYTLTHSHLHITNIHTHSISPTHTTHTYAHYKHTHSFTLTYTHQTPTHTNINTQKHQTNTHTHPHTHTKYQVSISYLPSSTVWMFFTLVACSRSCSRAAVVGSTSTDENSRKSVPLEHYYIKKQVTGYRGLL